MANLHGIGGAGSVRPDIEVAAAPANEAQAPAAGAATLSVGARGPEVKALQEKLAGLGLPVSADGIFGPKTASAVAQFQKAHGLASSGCADAATLAALDQAA